MFTTASKLASIASRQNATLTTTRQLASKKANSSACSFVNEVSPHVKLMDDARHGKNHAQRMIRKLRKHKSSTEDMRIVRNLCSREEDCQKRFILEKVKEKVQDKSRTSRIMSYYDPSHPDADKCGYVPGSPWTGCYWRCCRGGGN